MAKIIYTHTDEAPLLATYSFLPIVAAYARTAGVEVETRDISLAGRIISQFPERLTEEQRIDDALAELGELATRPEANIIKLPNISASIPQLKAAIKELQDKGYDLPDYPENPQTDEDRATRAKYDKVKGSAVNPVLREGNSDRRAPGGGQELRPEAPALDGRLVRRLADQRRDHGRRRLPPQREVRGPRRRRHPAHRAHRRRRHRHRAQGRLTVLAGEVVDATVMSVGALNDFLAEQIARAKADDVLFSVHLKATMMKVSDPIIFGHVVRAFFPRSSSSTAPSWPPPASRPTTASAASSPDSAALADGAEIKAAIEPSLADGPPLAMVDSDKGITNLHVPSDVIVDASMPAMIRTAATCGARTARRRTRSR